ncbi:ATPase WRNIP1-like [Microplitis mediator]|uniref:ATPase WRNIP1-like n=1 Tax=Microplitis mediator TaxID=375433 RepID=UPI002557BBFB|nr:ATPase WRNIP1-like [Microplitis mediator]XP_057333988.1 ATPase WRNIP1-like [Microplitis mediator]XP_057333989.1 ATPase WRNIP1-like [Microplitis mediator]XP_057333990.1 ATPase WRNIP1-like [Microplitis mediator]
METNEIRELKLVDRLRPLSLEDYFGHKNVIGEETLLGKMLDKKEISSMILWGPTGCGKTSLANVIANMNNCNSKQANDNNNCFIKLSAATCGIGDIRTAVKTAIDTKKKLTSTSYPIIVFMDEIHRFNKLQQDIFLPHIEAGTFILIGATTENPSFSLNSALISRCRVFKFDKLTSNDIKNILNRGLLLINNKLKIIDNKFIEDIGNKPGCCTTEYTINQDALQWLAEMSNGDARIALNTLELMTKSSDNFNKFNEINLSLENVKINIERAYSLSAKECDINNELVSAMHKSIKASDLNAALYWLARLMANREDPVFIGKRLIRIANEDVDISDPDALDTAVHTMHACQMIGMPECDVMLGQCVIYLCKAKKIKFFDRFKSDHQLVTDNLNN